MSDTESPADSTQNLENKKRQKLEHENTSNRNSVSDDDIHFKIFTNDGSASSAEALITLKNIISRQLPKMPKEYIVRLVFDQRHYSLAICRSNRIIGGICYRPYFDQKFGEIAFCAINGSEQVKGFGTSLMNQLKHHVQKQKLEYFLTYADNYALGYFQKQGFTKNVVMPKERWVGFIKDYDGGTLMECYIHPTVDYLKVTEIIGKQRSFIHDRIKTSTLSCVVHDGIELFFQGKRFQAMEIPGVQSSGWSAYHLYKGSTDRDRISSQNKLSAHLKIFVERLRQILSSKQLKSASTSKNLTYLTDLETITMRLKEGDYYRNKEMMITDSTQLVKSLRESLNDGFFTETFDMIDRLIVENLKDSSNSVVLSSDKDSS